MRNKVIAAGFVLLLVTAIIILVTALAIKNNEEEAGAPFWQRSVVYQVYPRSLLDSLTDGTGDLPGIKSKVGYLAGLGVGVVWLSPVYPSPMKDFGYDISDFKGIEPIFGTMKDFEELVAEVHHHGLKLVMDFVPNHSSDQHDWFQRSVMKEAPYTDYYVWANASGTDADDQPLPPNNWLSVFRGSAWQWNDQRQQFYLHQYLSEQPDLNFRNPLVRDEMKDVLTFWLEKGVDGFRVDAIERLYEVEDLSMDEPASPEGGADPDDYASLQHLYTSGQPETFSEVLGWRQLLDQYPDKLMMVEASSDDVQHVMKYYGNQSVPLAHFPFNFFLISNFRNRSQLTGESLKATVDLWLDNMPEGMWPNWVLGNHDNGRVATRLGSDLVDGLNMVLLLLPGTPVTYQGEELGMEDTYISWEDSVDPQACRWGSDHYQEYSRDPERTPFQWDDSNLAGFTTGNSTWLPVNPNYKTVNVAAQEAADTSHLKVYQELTRLRQEDAFTRGQLAFPFITRQAFTFVRFLSESEGDSTSFLLVLNTSQETITLDLMASSSFSLPSSAEVVLRSITDTSSATKPGSVVALDAVTLVGGEGLVLRFQPGESA